MSESWGVGGRFGGFCLLPVSPINGWQPPNAHQTQRAAERSAIVRCWLGERGSLRLWRWRSLEGEGAHRTAAAVEVFLGGRAPPCLLWARFGRDEEGPLSPRFILGTTANIPERGRWKREEQPACATHCCPKWHIRGVCTWELICPFPFSLSPLCSILSNFIRWNGCRASKTRPSLQCWEIAGCLGRSRALRLIATHDNASCVTSCVVGMSVRRIESVLTH